MSKDEDIDFIRSTGVEAWAIDFDADYEEGNDRRRVHFEDPAANAYGSEVIRISDESPGLNLHILMLDIDRHALRVIPSATPGHSHLVIPGRFAWEDVSQLLELLMKMGIIEGGFCHLAQERGQVFLRIPGIKKES
jgi:hypothetical protein